MLRKILKSLYLLIYALSVLWVAALAWTNVDPYSALIKMG